MKVYLSAACVVTILCIFATFTAQGICDHDGKNHNTDIREKMEGNHHSSYDTTGNYCSNGNMDKDLSLVVRCCKNTVYNPLNELCCESKVHNRSSVHTKCCGADIYVTTTHICCNDKIQLTGTDCNTTVNGAHSAKRTDSKNLGEGLSSSSNLKCGEKSFDPEIQICCSGKLYKNSGLNKCCGDKVYTPVDDKLCCNGTLHSTSSGQPECVGGVLYEDTDCQTSTRSRHGKHCCGGQFFEPEKHICCNGHRHNKGNGHFCCGSKAYNPHNDTVKCCSGHLYHGVKQNAECCGHLLLNHSQNHICCSSLTHSLIYSKIMNHQCCGHDYYNMSLWNCCAEHLKPLKERKNDGSHQYNRLKPLTDLIPELCSKGLLGKVYSMTLDTAYQRLILLQVLAHTKSEAIERSWLEVKLDHCSTPVLKIGMTYVWMKSGDKYKPVSQPIDLTSDIHILYEMFYQQKCHKPG